ncbi:WD-40 repeat-containing protein MSI2-like [Chenopodium quinoa]|uniref:WD-40 repeat-containing protein MSI2-like n=1 Tax=Chenopodium quinoa TaxID=63459 RepID=UPI000B77D5AE|nr:WD-40 repeat-containing protein MSI2-like [Chenopodium quinoa]
MGEEDEVEMTEAQLNEEFAVWKKNTPILYDLVVCHPLEWPSLTVQWLPSSPQINPDSSLAVHQLILGTHTSDDSPNYLMVADAHLPSNNGPCSSAPKVEIVKKFCVDGEVNRAGFMPQKPNLVAAKTSGLEVYVFDVAKEANSNSCDPEVRLRGHEKEGYGLSWSPLKEGYLLSGSYDCKICLWDVSSMPQSKVLDSMNVYKAHENIVEHVAWHPKNENLFGSVGDDARLMIWDLRSDKPQQSVIAHEKEVNYLSFNSFNEWSVATASSDTTIGLFDIRKIDTPLHALSSHTEEVFQVEWDPNHETVLASSSDDRRLMVWDLNRVGDEQLEGEAQDGPPELLFSHGGHKAKISDFSWNKNEPWMISSVADDNTVQIWQMAENIYRDEDDIPAE